MGAAREPVPGLRHRRLPRRSDPRQPGREHRAGLPHRPGLLRPFPPGPLESVTAAVLRSYFATQAHLAPATRARREAALASFLRWAYRYDLIEANPMDRLDRVRLPAPIPRGLAQGQVEAILAVIPRAGLRDRVLFGLIA